MDKLCLWCDNFHMDPGCDDYPEYTPGDLAEVSCSKGRYSLVDYITREEYSKAILTAVDCNDFYLDPAVKNLLMEKGILWG